MLLSTICVQMQPISLDADFDKQFPFNVDPPIKLNGKCLWYLR